MMPSWLWTCILFVLIVPLHLFVVGPALDGHGGPVRFAAGLGYFVVGVLWGAAGRLLKVVRR